MAMIPEIIACLYSQCRTVTSADISSDNGRYFGRILVHPTQIALRSHYGEEEIRAYTFDILEKTSQCGGVAYGSGNSIPDYVPVEGYLVMNRAIREFRGEKL